MYGLLPRPGPPALPLQPSVSDQVRVDPDLDVDLVQPDLLLSPCRVRADVQDILHLAVPDEQDVSGDEESDALRAGGAGQGAYRECPKKKDAMVSASVIGNRGEVCRTSKNHERARDSPR